MPNDNNNNNNKKKAKYLDDDVDGSDTSSTSSSDDDDDIQIDDEVEIEFLRTLSSLKGKDPSIYEEGTRFFENVVVDTAKRNGSKRQKPIYVNDHERNLLMEYGGVLPDSDDDHEPKPE